MNDQAENHHQRKMRAALEMRLRRKRRMATMIYGADAKLMSQKLAAELNLAVNDARELIATESDPDKVGGARFILVSLDLAHRVTSIAKQMAELSIVNVHEPTIVNVK